MGKFSKRSACGQSQPATIHKPTDECNLHGFCATFFKSKYCSFLSVILTCCDKRGGCAHPVSIGSGICDCSI